MAYLIAIWLVDPLKPESNHKVVPSPVVTAYGLVKGDPDELEGLDEKAASELVNDLLASLTSEKGEKRLLARSSHGGRLIFCYCSRCGSRFEMGQCPTCKIRLSVSIDMAVFLEATVPAIPDKVIKYFEKQGHTFATKPNPGR